MVCSTLGGYNGRRRRATQDDTVDNVHRATHDDMDNVRRYLQKQQKLTESENPILLTSDLLLFVKYSLEVSHFYW